MSKITREARLIRNIFPSCSPSGNCFKKTPLTRDGEMLRKCVFRNSLHVFVGHITADECICDFARCTISVPYIAITIPVLGNPNHTHPSI